jgi:hypothetical protein
MSYQSLPADMTRDNMPAIEEELLPYFQDKRAGLAAAGE